MATRAEYTFSDLTATIRIKKKNILNILFIEVKTGLSHHFKNLYTQFCWLIRHGTSRI